jgi:YfiH family protein
LKAGFSTRAGGVSEAYGARELNLSWTKEDSVEAVAANREGFLRLAMGDEAAELVAIRQVHGAVVQVIEAGHGPLTSDEGRGLLEGDGLVTAVPGLLLAVQTADCVPVLVADVRQRVVGAFHAGWRGTVARIAELGVGTMRERYGCAAEDLVAAVGPSIGPCCFAVGNEVKAEFAREFAYGGELFREKAAQMYGDLWEANRRQLVEAGVRPEKVTVLGECTACARVGGERKYFSHRAEGGVTGRMLGVIGVVGKG